MRASACRDDELAFYDALETNDSAVQVLGNDTLARRSPVNSLTLSAAT